MPGNVLCKKRLEDLDLRDPIEERCLVDGIGRRAKLAGLRRVPRPRSSGTKICAMSKPVVER
ncbi:MAG: hypothetical protein U0Q12_00605 [Vicinamibacterales bacterium]